MLSQLYLIVKTQHYLVSLSYKLALTRKTGFNVWLKLGFKLNHLSRNRAQNLVKDDFVGLLARGRCLVGHRPLCSIRLRHYSKMPRNHISGSVCAWLLASDGISFFARMGESEPDAPHQILVDANRVYRLFQRIRNRVDVTSNRQSHL